MNQALACVALVLPDFLVPSILLANGVHPTRVVLVWLTFDHIISAITSSIVAPPEPIHSEIIMP